MTADESDLFDAQVEKEFKSHQTVPSGRNFLAFTERFHKGDVQKRYDMGFCRTFPGSPGSRMCGACAHEDCGIRNPDGNANL